MNKITLKDLSNKKWNFIIPNYQRGYKWSEKNINALLDDINSIGENNEKEHCLHNLTVIKYEENNTKYIEVIDGQQRLTTIFLIFNYLKYNEKKLKINYTLDYQIRWETKHFLDNKLNDVIKKIKEEYKETKDLFEEIKNTKITNIDDKSTYNKQDIYFICNVLFFINKWFNDNPNNNIINNFDKTYFYEHDLTDREIKGETIFANLNSGKIDLTDIELIKADLIINISKQKSENNNDVLINEIRSNIGRLWDEMEIWLGQDKVWFWISGKNHINKLHLLFELLFGEKKDKKEDMYDIYKKQLEKMSYEDILEKIKYYYYTIKNWYYDNDFYHLVGIAIGIGIKLKDIIKLSKDKTKNKFIEELIKKIKSEIKIYIRDDKIKIKIYDYYYNYYDLNYNDTENSIKQIFLLLNALEGFSNDHFNDSFRYRFDLHHKQKWSIEHILPQNPNKENIEHYLKDLILYLINMSNKQYSESINNIQNENIKNLIEECRDEKEINELKINEFIKNNKDYKSIRDAIDNLGFIHSIGNLALLDKNTNSAFSNSIFKDKRDVLIKKITNEGSFIPPLTLKIFSKNFDGSDREKEYWTHNDFEKYTEYQENKLKLFFKFVKLLEVKL
ncbi:DUF262 domain-containing protein [Brachyspira pilosicoli]|uniref:DUF262 domain-containing protein n=1 Tax=Brachyspira pilosicoli TaxID=52584 RepID=UPI00300565F0